MQNTFLRLLPVPVKLGARLAMFVIIMSLISLVLGLFTLFGVLGVSPVDTATTLSWVVLVGCALMLGVLRFLWRTISRDVLTPLERIMGEGRQDIELAGLGHVAAKVQELRDTINRTQAELDESHQNLRQVEKLAMVGKLAAGIAHSVRNPLTSVKLRLFSLERSLGLTAQQKEDFVVIAEAMRHVDSIVSNFLEFSRRPQLRLQAISIGTVVDASLKLLENRLAAFPVSISRKRESDLPLVKADPEQLREVMLNILLNACEAMDYSGNLIIEELLVSTESDSSFVCIRILDSGPGIAEEQLEEIFQPFFSTKEQGTGLGLPIAKGILEEHGGDIAVQSSAKHGTAFSLLLPVTGSAGKKRSQLYVSV